MKRHECHAVLCHLEKMGLIKKKEEMWCLDDTFLKALQEIIVEFADLLGSDVRIEYMKKDA